MKMYSTETQEFLRELDARDVEFQIYPLIIRESKINHTQEEAVVIINAESTEKYGFSLKDIDDYISEYGVPVLLTVYASDSKYWD